MIQFLANHQHLLIGFSYSWSWFMLVCICYWLDYTFFLLSLNKGIFPGERSSNMPESKRKAPIWVDRKPPTLVDLCVNVAISNVRYLGDVGETDLHLLDRILPHCTLDQLMHVEKSTVVRCLMSLFEYSFLAFCLDVFKFFG